MHKFNYHFNMCRLLFGRYLVEPKVLLSLTGGGGVVVSSAMSI